MRFVTSSVSKLVAITILAALSSSAFAQSAGSTVISAGWLHIGTSDSSSPLILTSPFIEVEPGGATLSDVNTVGFSVDYFFTDNWVGSFGMGIPPNYNLRGTGVFDNAGEVGKAKQWMPEIVGKYYFGNANSPFRPFVGLGISRSSYKNISLTNEFQQYVAADLGQPNLTTSIRLGNSWAPLITGGISYAITKDWYANFSVSYRRLRTAINLSANLTPVPYASGLTMHLDPLMTYLSVGYRF